MEEAQQTQAVVAFISDRHWRMVTGTATNSVKGLSLKLGSTEKIYNRQQRTWRRPKALGSSGAGAGCGRAVSPVEENAVGPSCDFEARQGRQWERRDTGSPRGAEEGDGDLGFESTDWGKKGEE
ncbi:hypothetical protein CRG98_006864 [Punica granatum]|uniref:Uncharacterized protein n=1 Tax=Punica granatum TaxID=22663 RepID=A0A2I0KWE7_PUNGR|nr:hypothetical protein CRG98_006864 [Punica granatum]